MANTFLMYWAMQTQNIRNNHLIAPHEPRFCLASTVRGVIKFGLAISRRRYIVNKTLDEKGLIISYMQKGNTISKISHVMTLGIAPHHKHLIIFYFDDAEVFHYANGCFPDQAKFKNIDKFIRKLGPNYEFAMENPVWHSNKLL